MATRLIVVAVLTATIHLINTLIYGARLSGVQTRRLATAISLFNIVFLISSAAHTIQAPLLSTVVEGAVNRGLAGAAHPERIDEVVASPFYQAQLGILADDLRLVILAATFGTVVGAFLIPVFVQVFSRVILTFDEVGSVPRLMVRMLLAPRKVWRSLSQAEMPGVEALRGAVRERLPIPKCFLVANVFVTGIYTIGVLSALYAGALFPQYRTTAVLLSGIVNGFATVLVATVVDPAAARLTDQALRGERSQRDVKLMMMWLAVTRFLGTLLAQVLFIPAALLIRWVAQLLV